MITFALRQSLVTNALSICKGGFDGMNTLFMYYTSTEIDESHSKLSI